MFPGNINKFENPLPPQEVHFLDLQVEPWEDKTRIKVFVKLSEFTMPPNLDFCIKDKTGLIFSEVSLIENIDIEFVFTMHLRINSDKKEFILLGEIFYQDGIGIVDSKSVNFSI
jgi:hypothetical protein